MAPSGEPTAGPSSLFLVGWRAGTPAPQARGGAASRTPWRPRRRARRTSRSVTSFFNHRPRAPACGGISSENSQQQSGIEVPMPRALVYSPPPLWGGVRGGSSSWRVESPQARHRYSSARSLFQRAKPIASLQNLAASCRPGPHRMLPPSNSTTNRAEWHTNQRYSANSNWRRKCVSGIFNLRRRFRQRAPAAAPQ